MILRSLKKCDEQNELTENDSDNIINMNKLRSRAIKFEEFTVKDKKRIKNDDEFIVFKIKNVKLADVLHRMTE